MTFGPASLRWRSRHDLEPYWYRLLDDRQTLLLWYWLNISMRSWGLMPSPSRAMKRCRRMKAPSRINFLMYTVTQAPNYTDISYTKQFWSIWNCCHVSAAAIVLERSCAGGHIGVKRLLRHRPMWFRGRVRDWGQVPQQRRARLAVARCSSRHVIVYLYTSTRTTCKQHKWTQHRRSSSKSKFNLWFIIEICGQQTTLQNHFAITHLK